MGLRKYIRRIVDEALDDRLGNGGSSTTRHKPEKKETAYVHQKEEPRQAGSSFSNKEEYNPLFKINED